MNNKFFIKKRLTHEKISSFDSLEAGLIKLLLEADHRCSIGEGAGISSFSINSITSSINLRSFIFGFDKVPAGKHVSETHCWPPQSNPKISSLHPTLNPSDLFQNSDSASLIFLTWSLLRGSMDSNLSLSSVNVRSESFESFSFGWRLKIRC